MAKGSSVIAGSRSSKGDTAVNAGVPWPADTTEAWARVLMMQTKLHQWATTDPGRRFDDVFNLVYDPGLLVAAWNRVQGNKGGRTAGVDGIAPRSVSPEKVQGMLAELRESVKGGGFVLLTGGRSHVFGPAQSMIEDNNQLGLALVMLLPLMNYLRVTSRSTLVTKALLVAMGLTLVAIIGTYSRGALLALAVSAVVYAARTRAGVTPLVLGALLLVALPSLMPGDWFHRMSTIQSYHQDLSFEGRVEAWRTSFEIARLRFLGGGFSAIDLSWVAQVYSVPGGLTEGRAAHSMYFEVLGDHGFMGLALYLMLIVAALFNTSIVISATRDRPEMDWAGHLARTLQISIAGYLVGGAALSMAYYDGFFILLSLSGALALLVRQPASQTLRQKMPRWREIGLPAVAIRTSPSDLRAGFRPNTQFAGRGAS